MQQVMDIINFILDMGPSIMMPIILFVMAMVFRIKISKAIRSSLTVGMGFIGINLVLGLMVETLSPATEAMVENFGLQLNVMDVGWPAASAIAFGTTSLVPWIFGLGILLNIVMIMLKWTKTLNIDLWNYWHFIFAAAFVYAATNNFVLAITIGLLTEAIVLILADISAPIVQDFFGMPGVSLPHTETISWAPVGWAINKIIEKIPVVREWDLDQDKIQEKFGIMGESLMIGTVIGLIIGSLAYGPGIATDMSGSLSQIINTAITLGAVMLIFPKMVKLLMTGLLPLSEGVKKFLNKRFPDRDLYIGLDAATVIGHPANVATGLILIPVSILLAVLLSMLGLNRMLPFADLAIMPILILWATGWSKGNIFRGVVIGSVFIVGFLVIGTFLAPMTTTLAYEAGFAIPEGATQISSLNGGAHLAPWLLMLPFIGNIFAELGSGFAIFSIIFAIFTAGCYGIFFYKAAKGELITDSDAGIESEQSFRKKESVN
ncbi:PTS galactitol transporter subunit IIC [Halanaerobium hydrogeniformans]|uniref:PTS system Galactitol-specific IIC component n=1 Tax=Halanaerobium hydrogeniformans TaxID=656519 RepID=E4RM22_HALHG|nr:PTS transporter subunit IIC [Halanaerobium hydrogeniformans]ADQ14105.1 PTS system Galactitol-specific IIC component [Halanaerobium hydrogeniformans]